jgi:hypothetical protein
MRNYDFEISELTKSVLYLDRMKKLVSFKSDDLKESRLFLVLLRKSSEELVALSNKIKDSDKHSSERVKLFHLGEILVQTQDQLLSRQDLP